MNRIKELNENVINQIAAGEVIERPASVVKELVENAIDAGATKIEIELSQGGRYLRVSDNGSGIHEEDIKLAFSRHATSKIVSEKDLWGLQSLGFRGEALASILSISKVTCSTKTKDAENGIKLTNSEDGELHVSPSGCANGTTIEISDLFYNVPARLKFLRKQTTEIAAAIETLQNIALAHPEVAFVCKNQNKTVLKTSGSNDLCITIKEIFSEDLINHLLIVNALDESEKYFINGVVTDPTFNKANRKSIYIIVNGRFIKCPILTKAVEKAFDNSMPSGRFPVAVLNIMIPADKLDVNVHPTKKEVRYSNTNSIFGFVVYAIKKALQEQDFCSKCSKPLEQEEKQEVIPEIKKEPVVLKDIPRSTTVKPIAPVSTPVKESKQEPVKPFTPSITKEAVKFYTPLPEKEIKEAAPLEPEVKDEQEKTEQLKIETHEVSIEPAEKKTWKIIGQAYNTYIILQKDDALQIIDQHIASERAIYDKLKRQEHSIAGQRLLILEEIEINLTQAALLEEYAEKLEQWGYEFENYQDGKISLKQVPQLATGKNQRELFDEIISLLENGGSIESIEDNVYKTLSCHSAVRAGDVLSLKEMETVISQWLKSDYPYTCPHGRKIAHDIPLKELSGFFDRQLNYIE